MDFLDFLFISGLTVIVLIYIIYLIILKVFCLSFHHASILKTSDNEESLPSLSIIVPTYNEATVIKSKLESLTMTSYPKEKFEIIVVDSGSTDGTPRIVEKYQEKGVILLKQEKRMGKANAINFALQKSKGDIIVLTDANAQFNTDALNTLVRKFDKNTGAVLPRYVPSGMLTYWDKFFHKLHHIYKFLEAEADSVFIVFGELFAFRKELIEKINEEATADDLEIALNIRKKGYKINYCPDVEVKEKIPSRKREIRIQKIRRIFGIIQAMANNFHFFLNPKYGVYGLLIFPTHFFQMTLGPFFFFFTMFSLIGKLCILLVNLPLLRISFIISFSVLIFLYFSSGFVKKIILLGYNFLMIEAFTIIALVNFIRGKKYHIWEKLESTRDQK